MRIISKESEEIRGDMASDNRSAAGSSFGLIGPNGSGKTSLLMARGLSQGEAQAAIVRGFLDTSIMGLPRELQKEVDTAISTCEKEAF